MRWGQEASRAGEEQIKAEGVGATLRRVGAMRSRRMAAGEPWRGVLPEKGWPQLGWP